MPRDRWPPITCQAPTPITAAVVIEVSMTGAAAVAEVNMARSCWAFTSLACWPAHREKNEDSSLEALMDSMFTSPAAIVDSTVPCAATMRLLASRWALRPHVPTSTFPPATARVMTVSCQS